MASSDGHPRYGLMLGGRPLLFEVWSRCCRRLELVPAGPGDGRRAGDVAVVLLDAGASEADVVAGPIVLLIDHSSTTQLIGRTVGVRAVVSWHDAEEELDAATRAVLGGGSYISSTAAAVVLGALTAVGDASAVSAERLTMREIDVLRALVDGATIKSTALELRIAVKTVEAHRASAFVKLGVRTRAQAIALLVGDPTILNGSAG